MPNVKYLIEAKSDLRIPLYPLPSNRTIACGQVVVSNSGRVFAITKTGRVYASQFSNIKVYGRTHVCDKQVRLADFPLDDIKALDRLCLLDADKVTNAQRESFKAREVQYVRSNLVGSLDTLLKAGIKLSPSAAAKTNLFIEKEAERRTKLRYDGRWGKK